MSCTTWMSPFVSIHFTSSSRHSASNRAAPATTSSYAASRKLRADLLAAVQRGLERGQCRLPVEEVGLELRKRRVTFNKGLC